ncbi:ribosome maturation factor RimM [Acidovorax sp. CCYZU-2555]|uniref:ribosome maturation factor RimM n=1 Tax=Acidovorax sp. CCYZU-2555 TaxID=2835042 RepID=UPI001BD0D8DA|nr:ribosome maturation factor RimM [Acidovorax sp. CCYZU-2555]MBS7777159.1 ribosome maturation factor RimM [Acidovorax sp. CCYZU-2555]
MALLPVFEPAQLPADAVEVGRIADAWGIKGWFKVLPFSADAEVLLSAKQWFLQPSERGARTFSGTVLLPVKQAREHSGSIVATADIVADRTAAESLKGVRIFVSRAEFPKAAEDEYYWVDLLGLDVINREGLVLGQVKDLMSTGPQTVLVIAYEEDGKTLERMIPFVSAYVDKVELSERRITVDWQTDY